MPQDARFLGHLRKLVAVTSSRLPKMNLPNIANVSIKSSPEGDGHQWL
jgi:hypothetical protein